METNIEYLQRHFLNEKSVIAASGCCAGAIRTFTQAGLAPRASYFPDAQGRLSSNLGHCDEPLEHAHFHNGAPAMFRKLKMLMDAGADLQAVQAGLQRDFRASYENHLRTLNDAGLIEPAVWDSQLSDENARQEIATSEFGHWLAGTYGVCTVDNTPQAIAEKECMVRNIDHLTAKGEKPSLSPAETARLIRYLRVFDQVTAPFAPFERPNSSRHRLCVQLPQRYDLTEAGNALLQQPA